MRYLLIIAVIVSTPVVHKLIINASSENNRTRYTTNQDKGKFIVKPIAVSVMLSIRDLLSIFFNSIFYLIDKPIQVPFTFK